ncbi:NAD(P)-dependent dehydrogenase (short-subunit alcohol dehydrogenase family) [Alteromonadaceae bacterium 2753L.S.0a.02]|nr:NAD(P)-dependent dehydrogenase (short-subunit alcohol dehydrogenase family) [Alteromonadaceae bacterium 2753L.S.0a.02]
MPIPPIALVTGSSRGIGAATARLLAENGYAVAINYRKNRTAAESIRDKITDLGTRCICIQADIGIAADVQRMYTEIDEQLGRINLLVNNAAILQTQCRFNDISEQRFKSVLQTNVIGSFLCCQGAVSRMSTSNGGDGGVIVNVSSGASKSGSPNEYIDYAASKGALDTLTRGLALEVAGEGIRVNGVRPGFIYTDMHADGGEPNRVDRVKSRIPLQRGGSAREVAEAILWLSGAKSSYITGSIIDVAGGV